MAAIDRKHWRHFAWDGPTGAADQDFPGFDKKRLSSANSRNKNMPRERARLTIRANIIYQIGAFP